MATTGPGILHNLRIKRVALVDKGANFDDKTGDGAHIMLYKRDLNNQPKSNKEKPVAKTLKDLFAKVADAVREPDAAKREAILKEAEAAAESMGAPHPPVAGTDQHLSTLQNLHKSVGEELTKMGPGPHPDDHPYHKAKTMHDNIGTILKALGCPVDGPAAPPMSEHVTKALSALEKQNIDLQKRLDIEVEKRLDGEMLLVLKSFKATPFMIEGANSDVQKFRKMKQDDPEAYTRMIELFKAADAQLAASESFRNVGAGGSAGAGSAYAEAEGLADKLMEKSADLTREQAIEKVFERNPKLYSRYVAEQQ